MGDGRKRRYVMLVAIAIALAHRPSPDAHRPSVVGYRLRMIPKLPRRRLRRPRTTCEIPREHRVDQLGDAGAVIARRDEVGAILQRLQRIRHRGADARQLEQRMVVLGVAHRDSAFAARSPDGRAPASIRSPC